MVEYIMDYFIMLWKYVHIHIEQPPKILYPYKNHFIRGENK